MFQVNGIESDQRLVLPQGLLGRLLSAARAGQTLNVAVCDQLCPALGSNPNYYFTGHSIPQVLHTLLRLTPPAPDVAVLTMAPDECDRARFAPASIRDQWRSVFDAVPAWQGIRFEPRPRVDFYGELPRIDLVIHTSSTEPYANVLLCLAPQNSAVLGAVPGEFSPELANRLSYMGHSHFVVAATKGTFDPDLGNCPRYSAETTLETMAGLLANAMLPDSYQQPADCVAQEPLCLLGFEASAQAALQTRLPARWQAPDQAISLSAGDFGRELRAQRTIALIETEGEKGRAIGLRNGVTLGL